MFSFYLVEGLCDGEVYPFFLHTEDDGGNKDREIKFIPCSGHKDGGDVARRLL